MAKHHLVGRSGEHIAALYLRARGYRILGCNVRIGHDEIDIIAHDPGDDVIVFVEVKARSQDHPDYTPMLNITYAKKSHVRRAAEHWIADADREWGWRLDLVFVIGGKVVDHIEDVGW